MQAFVYRIHGLTCNHAGQDEAWKAPDICDHRCIWQQKGHDSVWAARQPSKQHSHLQSGVPASAAEALWPQGVCMLPCGGHLALRQTCASHHLVVQLLAQGQIWTCWCCAAKQSGQQHRHVQPCVPAGAAYAIWPSSAQGCHRS